MPRTRRIGGSEVRAGVRGEEGNPRESPQRSGNAPADPSRERRGETLSLGTPPGLCGALAMICRLIFINRRDLVPVTHLGKVHGTGVRGEIRHNEGKLIGGTGYAEDKSMGGLRCGR